MAETPFNRIYLMGRAGVPGVPETIAALIHYLHQEQRHVILDPSTLEFMPQSEHTLGCDAGRLNDCDLVIVVGGDGSLLTAAKTALPYQLPVLGINRGRLGFLTDIHPLAFHTLGEVLNGHYTIEHRALLNAIIQHDDNTLGQGLGLNDVVLLPGIVVQMIEFETYINGQFVCRQRADGLIVATPTGSTAYALSGGGPILHPQLDAIALVPMFPHTLSSRPIVVRGDSQIEIRVSEQHETPPNISCDGQERLKTPPGSHILIHKHSHTLQLVHPKTYNYFSTLREKLGWEYHAVRPPHNDEY